MTSATAWVRRYTLAILVALAATALGLLEVFSLASVPTSFPLGSGEHLFVVTQETAVGDDGPVFTRTLRPHDLDAAAMAMAEDRHVPLRVADALLEADPGRPVGTRIASGNAELLRRVAFEATVAATVADQCRTPSLVISRALADRLAVSANGLVKMGSEPVRVAGVADLHELSGLPGAQGVEGLYCADHPAENADRLLIFSRSTQSTRDLIARLPPLSADLTRNEYTVRWAASDIATLQGGEFLRRSGWLSGTRVILLALAAGAIVILASLQALLQAGDDHVRLALGETARHRFKRAAAMTLNLCLIGASAAVSVAALTLMIWTAHDQEAVRLREHLGSAVAYTLGYALFFSCLAGVGLWAGRIAQSKSADRLRAAQASRAKLPMQIACLGVAILCAAIAVPAAFLASEFARLSNAPQGYQAEGLYSAEIRLLGHKEHGREEQWQLAAWQRLSALMNDLAATPGVTAVGAMGSAPWSYTGEATVVSGQEHMILNVSATSGAVSVLKPARLIGADLSPAARAGTEVLVHGLDEREKAQFVPNNAAIVGELAGFRFSPLSDPHRKAIITPMQGAVPPVVSIIIRFRDDSPDIAGVQQRLARYEGHYIAGALTDVSSVIRQRLQAVRLSATTATVAASFSLALLLVVMLVTLRLYTVANRKEIAIRLCIGASASRLVLHITASLLVIFASGWIVGSFLGSSLWGYLVEAMQDYRLTQPWSSHWLLPPAVLLVGVFAWTDLLFRTRRLDLRDALSG